MDLPHTGETPADDIVYAYKSSLMGAPFEFRLGPDAMAWRKGPFSGTTPYRDIRRVRLSFRPMSMYNYRFAAEFWQPKGPKLQAASTSWKSLVEHERLDAPYRAFVTELCRRVGAAGGETEFVTGSPALLYWPGVLVLAGAGFGIVGLVVRAVTTAAWGGAALLCAFLAFFAWQGGTFFWRNQPGTFDPNAVPDKVLPRG